MNRGELSLKMSRRPKTFAVLLLVAMFLMTQVAVAGAAVSWNSLGTVRINGSVSGTVYEPSTTGNVYATVYANVVDTVTNYVYTSSTPVVTAQYIYDAGQTFYVRMANYTGLTIGRQYKVVLNVYSATTAAGINLANAPQNSESGAFTLFGTDSSSSSGGGGGGSSPTTTTTTTTTTPNTTVTPTITAPVSAAIDAAKGGTLTAGGITVNVPAGAISGNGTLTATPVTDLSKTPVGTVFKLGSTVVDIVLSGATLTGTLEINLNYDKAALANVPADQIGISYWNEARGGWVYVGGKVDTATGKVTVGVNHLTKFAVIANPNLKIPADINGNWAFDSIKRLLGMGVVSGYTDGSFKPGNNVTRAEFAKIMVDAMGWKKEASPSLKFADSAQIGDWAKGYVATAVYKGIIAGYSDNTFKPSNQITRAEIATMVVKALGKAPAGTPAFSDASSIPAWAQGYVAVAAQEGIVAGYSDKTFKAGNNATRAEAAKMTTNLLTNLKI